MSPNNSLNCWTWRLLVAATTVYWLFAFFFWHFMGWLSPFIAPFLWLPVYGLALTALIFAIVLPIRRWRSQRARSLWPLAVFVALFVATGFVDFTNLWIRANFIMGRSSREKIVHRIAARELRPNVSYNAQLIRLPALY